jgi:hypothetical protein
VLNYARGPQAAPVFGTTVWPAPSPYTFTDGRFGSSLKASPYMGATGNSVHTGWNGPCQGALTLAFFLRNQLANSTGSYSPVAGQPGWSIATGGSAGAGLQLHGWGGPDLNATFATSLCSMSGWNHFAVVVDPAAGQARWYHDGALAVTTAITGGVSLGTGELLIGSDYVNSCGSMYDVDEFRMLGRAASAAEILSWCQAPSAAVQVFGAPAGVTIDTMTLPTSGSNVTVNVNAQAATVFVFAAGFSYASNGSQQLPADLGALSPLAAGRMLLVAPQATMFGVLTGGQGQLTLGMPQSAQLRGAQLFGEAFGVTPAGTIDASNAIALRVGGPQ